MNRNIFEVVSALFQSVPASVAAANRLGNAYAIGVGHPDFYSPYTAEVPEKVAMDLAGLYAADSAANILAMTPDGQGTEEAYLTALRVIASGDLSSGQKFIVKNFANATWRAGQPFRGITTKPLDRITRDVNKQFNLLPVDEADKDLVQVQEGARILLEAYENQ